MGTVRKHTYKGKASVVLESERIRAEFIQTGARMVSFLDRKSGREYLLQSSHEELKKREFDSYYPDCDPAGFDDMFPTIDECYYEDFPWKGTKVADHGEVWSQDWKLETQSDSIEMWVYGIRFPYKLSKKIYFKHDGLLRIEYRAENLSPFDMNFLWAAHPMIQVEAGSRIIMPEGCRTGYTITSRTGRMGNRGDVFDLEKLTEICSDGKMSLTVREPGVHDMEKFYVREKLHEGACRVEYADGDTFDFQFPVQKVPYIAVLVSEGFDDEPNCWAIIEPATALYDRIDLAKANQSVSVLKGNESFDWYLELGSYSNKG